MTTTDVMKLMGDMGVRYSLTEFQKSFRYIYLMMRDERVISIDQKGDSKAILFFSIGNDWQKFYKKKTWDYMPHTPNERTIYVEKLVSKGWNSKIRSDFQDFILRKYPQIDQAIWHRYAKWGDRKVTWRRTLCMKSES